MTKICQGDFHPNPSQGLLTSVFWFIAETTSMIGSRHIV